MDPVTLGTLASLAAGSATAAGALPVLLGGRPTQGMRDAALGFAAGVMLSASFFSLIQPAIERAGTQYGEGLVPPAIACAGILLGAGAVAAINRWLPHEHFVTGREGWDGLTLRRIWLLVIAMAIHNFPEGMAVGMAFGDGRMETGLPVAVGIGIQNAPEGLAVAAALNGEGYGRWRAFGIAALTGLVEPVGGFLGAATVSVSEVLLPWGLVFAAGAMLFVISHEIIPETHRNGHHKVATTGLLIGLVVMLFLDVWLG